MVGDSPYDIEAAHGASLQTIAFRCGGWDDRDLEEALVIYDGPRDMHIASNTRHWDWPAAQTAPRGGASSLPANFVTLR